MLCPIGNNTKERVMDTFVTNNLISSESRTDGTFYVLKQDEFDAENQRLSAQMLADHNILNSFWTREGNTARFSDTFAHLVDLVGGLPVEFIKEDNWTGPDLSPQEEAFVDSEEFKSWGQGHVLGDEDGNYQLLFHGTTHSFDITEAAPAKSNPDNHFGPGIYFTTSELDAESNYATEGPDLKNRIEALAEQMENDLEISHEEALNRAREQLKGREERIIRAFVKSENPYDLTTLRYDSLYETNEDEDYVENEDSLPFRLYEAIQTVARETDAFDNRAVWQELSEKFEDFDGVKASKIDEALRSLESLMYAETQDGNLINHMVIGKIYQEMGFDSIIMDADSAFGMGAKGKQMVMDRNTKHVIVFDPTLIRSSTGNITAINTSPGLPDILVPKNYKSPC